MALTRASVLTTLMCGVASLSAPCQIPPAEPDASLYAGLTNNRSSATNFNIETVRGIVVLPGSIYAINTHGSTIVRHADLTPAPEDEWATVNNPVAITSWNDRLLVVGGGTWSLVEHDRNTGNILRHVALPAEPADIVVDDQRDEAYVACQGANVVVRIDLITFTENLRYDIPSQRPRFLSIDDHNGQRRIYVAPFLSGNNTTLTERQSLVPGPDKVNAEVVDLDATSVGDDLPDEDLYCIDPLVAPTPGSNSVTPNVVLHGAGTLLCRHGRNPATGDYWIVGTEAHNGDHNTEDAHRGDFANAQLAIASTLGGTGRPTPGTIRDLDVPIFPGVKAVGTSMSFPQAMAFHSTGWAVVASTTSDLLTFVDVNGYRFHDIPLDVNNSTQTAITPAPIGGAIPRDLWLDEATNTLIVYCWGWNKLLVYDLTQPALKAWWFELGADPLPVAAKKGRAIWYDAKRTPDLTASSTGAVTCNTCHPGGGMDLLGWGLSDSLSDIKDLMVTQSLLSISDTFPYHWRGERNLDHFNGAFVGLLGHANKLDESVGGELDQFKAFVFSLQGPANPNQSVERRLLDASAQQGQIVFTTKDNVLFGQFKCVDCHAFPAGTNGNRVADFPSAINTTTTMDVAHLRQLWHKDQGGVWLNIPHKPYGSTQVTTLYVERALGGFGLAHQGIDIDLKDFLEISPSAFSITPQERDQLVDFMRQFDQGIAPAAHRAYFVNEANKATVGQSVTNILGAQSVTGWVDVVAIGQESVSGSMRNLRWAFDAGTDTWTCHDATVPARNSLAFFNAITGQAAYAFLGMPPGNAARFALDPDNDGLTDAQEAAVTPTPTNPRHRDPDGDGFDDGYEVANGSDPHVASTPNDTTAPGVVPGSFVKDHHQATFAKFFAEFDEPVTWKLEAVDILDNDKVVSVTRGASLQRKATIHMHELVPSTRGVGGYKHEYVPRLTVYDPKGNATTVSLPKFQTADNNDMIVYLKPTNPPTVPAYTVTVHDLKHITAPIQGQSTQSFQDQVTIRYKSESTAGIGFAQGHVVIAQVLIKRAGSHTWTKSPAGTLQSTQLQNDWWTKFGTAQRVKFVAIPGPFLISSPTLADGTAQFSFTQSGINPGDAVRLSIVTVVVPVTPPQAFTYEQPSLILWDHPSTQGGATPTVPGSKDLRGLTTQF